MTKPPESVVPEESRLCPYILNSSFDEHEGARCNLIEGHDGKHRADSLGKTVTWPSTRGRSLPESRQMRGERPRAAYVLAMLALQSDRYQSDAEYRDAVDDVLACVKHCYSCGQMDYDHRAHCPEDVEAIKKALLALPPHKERPPQAYRYE